MDFNGNILLQGYFGHERIQTSKCLYRIFKSILCIFIYIFMFRCRRRFQMTYLEVSKNNDQVDELKKIQHKPSEKNSLT